MSPIISEADPNEKLSPFYQKNLSITEEWEKFILSKNGKVKGKVTSWALILKAKIENNGDWVFRIEKSTMSNGSLFLSSKKNQYQKTKISANQIDLPESFKIVRQNFFNKTKSILTSSTEKLNSEYMISYKSNKDLFKNNNLIEIFKNRKDFYQLEKIEYNQVTGNLNLSFDSIIMDFEFITDLLNIGSRVNKFK